MPLSRLTKQFNYFLQAFSDDYFAMFIADLNGQAIELLRSNEPIVPALYDFMSKNKSYSECINFFAKNFVTENEQEIVLSTLSVDSLKIRLNDYGLLHHKYHHKYQEKEYETEVSISDTSEKHDGSRCIIMLRFLEGVFAQQEAMKKQDDMMRTLVSDYYAIYHLDLENDSFVILKAENLMYNDIYERAHKKLPYSATLQDFVEKTVHENYQENMLKMVDLNYAKERLSKEKSFSFRYKIKEKRNGMEYFEMQFSRVNPNESGFYAIATFKNIDNQVNEELRHQREIDKANEELKRSIEAAEGASRAKTDFLSRMSHDIRTPMNAIIGVTAIAGANINDTEKIKSCLEKISSSSRHLLGIINDILDMSRIESGKVQIHEEEFKISTIFTESIEMIKPQIREHNHELKVHVNDINHETVVGDPNRIQQVFANILSNAVKYTPDNGHITVSVEEKKSRSGKIGTYIFRFEDDGIGMSKEFLEKIFHPFEREEDLRTSKIKGSGLGMAIAQNIVQLMGGTLEVESELSKGSTFIVTLPLKLCESDIEDSAELIGLPVLVADDDQIVCESTCVMLDEIGMKGDWVLSGKGAIEKVSEHHKENDDYFAVILDWKMPDMDGLETLKRIREKVGPEIPIIIFSAYDWSDIEYDAKAAGANAFISKPLFKSGLIKVFHDIMHPEETSKNENGLYHMKKHDFSEYRLLLVEDNEINMEIMEEIVSTTKAKIETAEDGKIALEKFRQSSKDYYDMILMDVQMPNMNGYEATKAIRALEREDAKTIPIIALTANTFEEDVRQATRAGMNEHLAKPIEIHKLSDVMGRWLGR